APWFLIMVHFPVQRKVHPGPDWVKQGDAGCDRLVTHSAAAGPAGIGRRRRPVPAHTGRTRRKETIMNMSRCQWHRAVVPAAATALACLWAVGAATGPVMGGAPTSSTTQTPVTPAAELPTVTAGFGLSNQRSNLQALISSANVA